MKRALITGAVAGLGKAIADILVAQHWQVIGIDRNVGTTITTDLSKPILDENMWAQLKDHAPYDLVIHNAGLNATGGFEGIDWQKHDAVLQVNAFAPIKMTDFLIHERLLASQARLLFVSSLSHYVGYPGAASYAASKDALAVYAKSISDSQALKDLSSTVTVAFPGPLRTDHAAEHAPQGADASKRMEPEVAAGLILADVMSGKSHSYPGGAARALAVGGKLFPNIFTQLMKRVIFDKL